MSLHSFIVFLHAATAVIWIGATFTLVYLANRAVKARSDADLAVIVKSMTHFSRTIIMPASIIVLLLGLYLVFGVWNFFAFWILFGILGIAATAVLNAMVLSPMLKDYEATAGAAGAGSELMTRILAIGKLDLVILFVLLFDMVVKPNWGNFLTWPLMLIILGAAAFFFLPRDLLPGQTPLERTREFTTDDDDDQ